MSVPPITVKPALHVSVGNTTNKPRRFDQFFANFSSTIKQKQLRLVKAVVYVAHLVVDLIRAIALKILWGYQSFGIHKETTLTQSASFYKETAKIQSEIDTLKNMPLEELQNLHPHPFVLDVPRQETYVHDIRFEECTGIGQKIFDLLHPKTHFSDHDLHIFRYLVENLLHQGSYMVVPGFFHELFTIHMPLMSADLAGWTIDGNFEGQKLLEAATKHSSLFECKVVDDKLIVSGLRYFRIFEMSNPNCNKGYDACRFEIAINIGAITADDFLLTKGAVTCKMQSYGMRLALKHILW